MVVVAATLALAFGCSDDDESPSDMSSPSGSVVPGEPQTPVNTDPVDSQVTPTIAP